MPLSQHDDIYRCDDIEIWKVFLDPSLQEFASAESSNVVGNFEDFQRRIVGSVVDVEVPLQMKARLTYEPFEESQRTVSFKAIVSEGDDKSSSNVDIDISQTTDGPIGCRIWASSILTTR